MSMIKIALVRAPCIEPFPPDLGLAYICAFLKSRGYAVSVFDSNIDLYSRVNDAYKSRWKTSNEPELAALNNDLHRELPGNIDKICSDIANSGFGLVGFSVWKSNLLSSLDMAGRIKRMNRKVTVVFGGPCCYPLWGGNEIMGSTDVDAVLYGEGELAVSELADGLSKGSLTLSAGGIIRDRGVLKDLGPGNIIHDLDSLPFPDFASFDLSKNPRHELFIGFNRGCINRCHYCSSVGTLAAYRHRSADSIFREMSHRVAVDGYSRLITASPGFNYDLKVLERLCGLIIDSKLRVSWGGLAMVRQMSQRLLDDLYAAGCDNLIFGFESGSQRLLEAMNKPVRIDEAERMLKNIHAAGIRSVTLNFIIGFPGETEEDFSETLGFIARNRAYISDIGSRSVFWIEPYSRVHSSPGSFGIDVSKGMLNATNHHWISKDGMDTMVVREERKARFEKFLKEQGYN